MKDRTIYATLSSASGATERLSFVEVSRDGTPMIAVYSPTACYGLWRLERYASSAFGREWVRQFARANERAVCKW